MIKKLSPDDLKELARQLVAGEITKEAYLEAVLGDAEAELDAVPGERFETSSASQQATQAAGAAARQLEFPPRRRLTDAEIDALARRAKAPL